MFDYFSLSYRHIANFFSSVNRMINDIYSACGGGKRNKHLWGVGLGADQSCLFGVVAFNVKRSQYHT